MWIPRLILVAALAPLSFPGDVASADMPKGLFHGTMVSFQGSVNTGMLLARDAAGTIYGCGYDSASYFEDQHEKTSVARLQPGDPLQILTDHKPGSRVCYLRVLHVVPPTPVRSPRKEAIAAPVSRPVIAPLHGDRTVAGIVIRLDEHELTVRTRTGEATMLLRRDTLYRGDGLRTDATSLSVNDRVSVRAGTNPAGQLEAYQVIWGDFVDVP